MGEGRQGTGEEAVMGGLCLWTSEAQSCWRLFRIHVAHASDEVDCRMQRLGHLCISCHPHPVRFSLGASTAPEEAPRSMEVGLHQ